ncbi:MAG: TetR/AcrR family transcriptional regulator [Pseudomonadota bacterium]
MSARASSPARSSKRLSKPERRQQLLQSAQHILEHAGAEHLTLALVAAHAGVSKPIAYDHFSTRAGLLVALLDRANQYYESDADAKIKAAPKTVPAIAEIVADAYVSCSLQAGPAIAVLSAAIAADAETRAAGRGFQADHADQFQRAFAPVLKSGAAPLLLFKSLVAAANAICDELMRKTVSKAEATHTLANLFITSLTPYARSGDIQRNSE